MSAIVADTSEWIEYFAGRPAPQLDHALAAGRAAVPPIVVAELLSGARTARDRSKLEDLLRDIVLPVDPFTHWVMWNIPASATGLPAELPAGTEPGVPSAETRQVSFRDNDAFAGSGACGNVYDFVLYALNVDSFDPPDDSSGDAVEAALEASDAVLGTATLRARSNPAGDSCN